MLISDFDQKVTLFKKLKAPLITLHQYQPDLIIGAFDDFNVIRTMRVNGDYDSIDLLRPNKWLNLGITSKDDFSGNIPEELIPMLNGPVIRNDLQTLIYVDVHRELNIKYNTIQSILSNYDLVYNDSELEIFDGYDQFMEYKASDGGMFIKLNPHICMTVYKGLIPYAKGDKILFNIYAGQTDFLAEFRTIKKKKSDPEIVTYVRYLYV